MTAKQRKRVMSLQPIALHNYFVDTCNHFILAVEAKVVAYRVIWSSPPAHRQAAWDEWVETRKECDELYDDFQVAMERLYQLGIGENEGYYNAMAFQALEIGNKRGTLKLSVDPMGKVPIGLYGEGELLEAPLGYIQNHVEATSL